MNLNNFSWDICDMLVVVKHSDQPVMKISVSEIIESCSRKKVLQHVAECDRTPWLTRWQNEKHQDLVDALSKDYV